jgi:3-oxoacyl-[acyl-carrier protein] reductase
MTIKGSTAVVTGATEGIGRATAFALGRAGARLAICSRTASNVVETVAALRAAEIDAAGTACDVGDPTQVGAFAEFVVREIGEPSILVNNAGIGWFGQFVDMPLEAWDGLMATNVRSLFLVTRAFLPAMIARGRGDIVNVASLAARNPVPGAVAYGASKHAVLGFSRSLLLEVRKHGIRVVAVCPGSVASPTFSPRSRERDPAKMLAPEDVAQTILSTVALPPERATVSELDIRPANP